MSDLSQDALALIDAARSADDPSPADRERVHAALTATLAASAGGAALVAGTAAASTSAAGATGAAASGGLSASPATAATAAATTVTTKAALSVGITSSTKLLAALVLAGTVGGTVALAPRIRDVIDSASAVATPNSVAPAQEASTLDEDPRVPDETMTSVEEGVALEEDPIAEAMAPVERAPAVVASRPPRRPGDVAPTVAEVGAPDAEGLLEELALLRRASEAARSGDPDAALRLLTRHRDLYPNGELSAERQAATVLALCDSGRSEEARATAGHFLERYRTSPLRERVRRACALGPDEEPASAD